MSDAAKLADDITDLISAGIDDGLTMSEIAGNIMVAFETATGADAVRESCAKICDEVVERAERLMEDPKAARQTLAAVANGAMECAENIRSLPREAELPVAWQYRAMFPEGSLREGEWCPWRDAGKKYFDKLNAEIAAGATRVQTRALYASLHPAAVLEEVEDHGILEMATINFNGKMVRWDEIEQAIKLRNHIRTGAPLNSGSGSLPREAELRRALEALYEWYDRDGSVGCVTDVFEDNRAALTSEGQEKKSTSSAEPACGDFSQASQRHNGDLQPGSAEASALHEGERAKEREACALVAEEHGRWAEEKIDNETSIFATVSNTANDIAEMIRHRDDPEWQHLRAPSALRLSVRGADAIEECAKIADGRAKTLREKAKFVTASRQSYFAQAIEARVIAEHIRALKTAAPDTTEGR